jgi:hypothetical protein
MSLLGEFVYPLTLGQRDFLLKKAAFYSGSNSFQKNNIRNQCDCFFHFPTFKFRKISNVSPLHSEIAIAFIPRFANRHLRFSLYSEISSLSVVSIVLIANVSDKIYPFTLWQFDNTSNSANAIIKLVS